MAVDPAVLVRSAVGELDGELAIGERKLPPDAGLCVLAVGKAAAPMARALEEQAGERIRQGLAVTKEGHGLPLRHFCLLEAGHPIPDARSEAAARAAVSLAVEARPDEVLVVLLSGGASALLTCPLPGLSQEDVAETTRQLLTAGAPIDELNTVRKHLLEVAGGRLAARSRARSTELLVISDVADDRLDVIGSGPCTPDPTTYEDALRVLERHALAARIPGSVLACLQAGARGEQEESPKPGAPGFERVHARILASNRDALQAARAEAERRGYHAVIATDSLRGEARQAGRHLAALGGALRRPVVLLAGGETTVAVRGPGRGGRSQELALAAAVQLAGSTGVSVLAAGTDGSDGPTDAAGAYSDGATLARGAARGADASASLERNDSYGFFAREGGLLHTGPTRTNVRDLVLLRTEGFPFPTTSRSV
jgi:glycerate-2-kinase